MKTIALLCTVLFIAITPTEIFAESIPSSSHINGLGGSVDYIHGFNATHKNDADLELSYRNGELFYVSGFLSADAGYQFMEKNVNGKAGAQLFFFIVGLEAGGCIKYHIDSKKVYPGGYAGLVLLNPMYSSHISTFSVGGNFYSKRKENQLYCKISTIINFK